MKNLFVFAAAVVLTAACIGSIVGCNSNAAGVTDAEEPEKVVTEETQSQEPQETEGGMAAMQKAADSKKYLFAFFRKAENERTAAMRGVLEEVMSKVADRADSVEVDVTSASEEAIVDKFDLDRAPMPLVLALAPNGAITGGFPTKVDKQSLMDAFVTPRTTECMKFLQDNRLVFLCVQNDATESNEAAMEGVNQFKADKRFAQATEILMLDPSDGSEAALLKDLQIDPKTKKAVTVFLAPPGTPIGRYEGATNKDQMASTLQKASSGCGPGGCGPGGCGPR